MIQSNEKLYQVMYQFHKIKIMLPKTFHVFISYNSKLPQRSIVRQTIRNQQAIIKTIATKQTKSHFK